MGHWISYRDHVGHFQHQRWAAPLDNAGRFWLDDATRDTLSTAALETRSNPYDPTEVEDFIAVAQSAATEILGDCVQKQLTQTLDLGFGAVFIANLPTDQTLPATPTIGGALPGSYKQSFVSEFVAVALGHLTGSQPFNFRQEGRGTSPLIDNIVPVKALQDQKGAGGYQNNFPSHSESAWHRLRPDYLILTGLRGDPRAQTLLFSVASLDAAKRLLERIPTPGAFRLAAPQLYQQMADQGMPMGTAPHIIKDPVVRDTAGGVTLNVNFNGTDCATPAAAEWLQELESFIEAHAQYVVLDPGTALIANNDRTCHTRSGYVPQFDGTQRWFQRIYLQRNLWAASCKPPVQSAAGQALQAYGWIDAQGNLTEAFLDFQETHKDLTQVTPQERALAETAYTFGPYPGSRIV